MAKPNKRKTKSKNRVEAVKIIALLLFIAIGIGVVGGTVWYYVFFQPGAVEGITDATAKVTKDYFNVTHTGITGTEGSQWMTEALAKKIVSGERVKIWKDRQIVSRVEGDIQVQILEQALRKAKTRAVFWQYEELEDKAGKDYLVYYDYDLVYVDGNWLVDEILTASEEGLKDLRKAQGVYDQHYAPVENQQGPED